jgi:uncharacterized protein
VESTNVQVVRRSYEYFRDRLEVPEDAYHPDFVWDMSTFEGWPERQRYEGVEGAKEFLSEWLSQWDNWDLEVRQLLDAGDRVVVICHQRGESKTTGARGDMDFAQVWTVEEGLLLRMEMYADVGEALALTGVADQREPDTTRRSAS